ncbi:MAG: hypothetical protein KGZ58_00100 [Ignavibacteriales bacterium]|nr:hypothetical protein [Ignavibacteriales bacterium]
MISHLSVDFIDCFERLPDRIKDKARQSYKLWKNNPNHPSLDFKKVNQKKSIYSTRVGIGWRALGVREDETIIWFWIGSHTEYDKILKLL